MMTFPVLIRWVFADSSSYSRLLAGTVLSFTMFQFLQQLSPFTSTSLAILSSIGSLQVFLAYFGATVLVANPSAALRNALGWVLLHVLLLVSLGSAALQIWLGDSQAEVEQAMLEYEAREADLALSTQELCSDMEQLRAPYGDVKTMTPEQKGAMDIHKGSVTRAPSHMKWVVPEGVKALPVSNKDIDRQFNQGQYPCFGECISPL